jgi:GAF domain-containing protein
MTHDPNHPRPIEPQDAFDELAKVVLSEQTMEGLLQRITELAQGVISGVDSVSISLLTSDHATTVVSTGDLATALDERQYDAGHGPCLEAAQSGTTALITDVRTESRWPDYTAAALAKGVLSSLSTPIPLQQYSGAAINMYSKETGVFDEAAQEIAVSFAGYAGVALANMHLYESTRTLAEQLQAAMDSRAVIEQAKGILMSQHHCTADAAFEMLVTLSQKSNRKLREVAQALVDSATLT